MSLSKHLLTFLGYYIIYNPHFGHIVLPTILTNIFYKYEVGSVCSVTLPRLIYLYLHHETLHTYCHRIAHREPWVKALLEDNQSFKVINEKSKHCDNKQKLNLNANIITSKITLSI